MKILLLAIRSLSRFRLYTIINILGLAMSLACVMIISRYVFRELTVDHFNQNLDRICLGTQHFDSEIKPRFSYSFNSRTGAGDPVLENNPSIEKITAFSTLPEDIIESDNQKHTARIIVTDTVFLQIMEYDVMVGNKQNLLKGPQDAVITQRYARKLFGSEENAIGKKILCSGGQTVTVTAVLKEPVEKSSIQFDMLVSYQLQKNWGYMFSACLLLNPGTDIQKLNKELVANDREGVNLYQLLPLKDNYFDDSVNRFTDSFQQGNFGNIMILSGVAFLILLVGIFNFINIYTVLMLKRARELGMKKVFGAKATQMLVQLLSENLAMIGGALFIAWLLIEISGEAISNLLEITQVNNIKFDLLLSLAILIVLPVITSAYPFIKYNYSTPISSLRSVNISGNSVVSRTIFMVFQYTITCCLIIVSLFFMKQLNFMLHADLGYRTKDIIKAQFLKFPPTAHTLPQEEIMKLFEDLGKKNEEIKQKLNSSPLFSAWTFGESPNEIQDYGSRIKTPDGEFKEVKSTSMSSTDLKIFELQLKEGRFWNDSTDTELDYKFIINETAQKLFGITNLETALLQPERRLWWNGDEELMSQNPAYQIIGIVKDFKYTHLAKPAVPLVISIAQSRPYNSKLTAVVQPGKRQEAIAFLRKLHDETIGGDFEYSFVEDDVNAMYKEDKKAAYIYSIFTVIAILISSLGLFSLSLFDVQQRYREIAIRKVNGATTEVVMKMMLRKYFKLLGLAFIISVPISLLAIFRYLENFANKTSVSWWIFAVALIVTAGISLATLIWQIRKAAQTNPATAMKAE